MESLELNRPRYWWFPTGDPGWAIRCEWNPATGHYDQDCQRVREDDVPHEGLRSAIAEAHRPPRPDLRSP